MLDVHPPHEAVHGWRDFLLHLVTITIGLLIALSLEGCVEWQHHRHLVREAEESLRAEIKENAAGLAGTSAEIKKQQGELAHDVEVLTSVIKTGKMPKDDHMDIGFHVRGFANVSWRTAQSTGAMAYMPYATAQEYSSIYNQQDELDLEQRQTLRDATLSLAPFVGTDKDFVPTTEQAKVIVDRIQILQGQLFVLSSFVDGLDEQYKSFLKSHP